MQEYQQLRQ